MTRDDALRFLRKHQPLPADTELDQTLIDKFDQTRKFFAQNPDPACVTLFLHVFGDGDGLGVYPLVEDTLIRQDRPQVIFGLKQALQSELHSVRYWCCQIAASFPDEAIVSELIALLSDDDDDIKYAALTALEQAATSAVKSDILQFSREVQNHELKEIADEIVGRLESQ